MPSPACGGSMRSKPQYPHPCASRRMSVPRCPWSSKTARASLCPRVAIVPPEGVSCEKLTETVTLPPGRSELAWPCTGVRRGDSLLEEVHLEIPSPFGLWLARARRQAGCQLRVYPNLRDRATAALFLRTANPGVRL